MNSEAMQKPVADEGADDADCCVADETETTAPYDLARQPSGNDPDDQNDNQSLVREMHGLAFAFALIRGEVGSIAKNLGQGQTWATDASPTWDRALRESAAATRGMVTESDIEGYGTERIAASKSSPVSLAEKPRRRFPDVLRNRSPRAPTSYRACRARPASHR